MSQLYYEDEQGIIHSCQSANVHPDVTLVWTDCEKDVPANKSFMGNETVTCSRCKNARLTSRVRELEGRLTEMRDVYQNFYKSMLEDPENVNRHTEVMKKLKELILAGPDALRRFCELAGIEPSFDHQAINCPACGYYCTGKTVFCTPPIPHYPDLTNSRVVLEIMRKRSDWDLFYSWLSQNQASNWWLVDLVIDRTGKLRDMAIEFMEGRNDRR